jgi:hypothetical protein
VKRTFFRLFPDVQFTYRLLGLLIQAGEVIRRRKLILFPSSQRQAEREIEFLVDADNILREGYAFDLLTSKDSRISRMIQLGQVRISNTTA